MLKIAVLRTHLCSAFLPQNGSLHELGDQRLITCLVVHWVCSRFVTEPGVRLEKMAEIYNNIGVHLAWRFTFFNSCALI